MEKLFNRHLPTDGVYYRPIPTELPYHPFEPPTASTSRRRLKTNAPFLAPRILERGEDVRRTGEGLPTFLFMPHPIKNFNRYLALCTVIYRYLALELPIRNLKIRYAIIPSLHNF